MILIFNKQYRQEFALISDLAKKSKSVIRVSNGNTELYKLDNININFESITRVLTVTDKNDNVIFDTGCQHTGNKLQQARYHMFSNLLQRARDTYDRGVDKAKAEKAAAEAKIIEVRKRIKSL